MALILPYRAVDSVIRIMSPQEDSTNCANTQPARRLTIEATVGL
jgi:hypothetical protein